MPEWHVDCIIGNFCGVIIFLHIFQLLQNLGKADKTTDEIFEEHLHNFNSQQANANRLHKDISNYIRCIKGELQIKYPNLNV